MYLFILQAWFENVLFYSEWLSHQTTSRDIFDRQPEDAPMESDANRILINVYIHTHTHTHTHTKHTGLDFYFNMRVDFTILHPFKFLAFR